MSGDDDLLLYYEAASLSSGTIASVSGIAQYSVIERIQAGFAAYCAKECELGRGDVTWQSAWNAWWPINSYKYEVEE